MKILKTIKEGLKRVFKINVKEDTPDSEVNDEMAKAIKIAIRSVLFVVLIWLFPDQAHSIIEVISNLLGL